MVWLGCGQGPGNVAIRPHLSDDHVEDPAPRDRVVQVGSRIPPPGRFRQLVQIVTSPRPSRAILQVAGTTRFQPTAGPHGCWR
jgi:hypothetical protein